MIKSYLCPNDLCAFKKTVEGRGRIDEGELVRRVEGRGHFDLVCPSCEKVIVCCYRSSR